MLDDCNKPTNLFQRDSSSKFSKDAWKKKKTFVL